MRLYYFTFLMLLSSISNLLGQSISTDAVGLFAPTEELSGVEKQQLLEQNHLQKADLFSLDETALQALYTENKASIRFRIPTRSEEAIVLELEQVQVLSPDFRVSNSKEELQPYRAGHHYRGKVVGQAQSMAAISIFEGEVMGMLGFAGNTYNLEKLHSLAKRTNTDQYILYMHEDVTDFPHFECHTSDEPTDLRLPNSKPTEAVSPQEKSSIVPVNVYLECDNKMYRDLGSSVQSTVDFTTGLFNVVAGLFADAGVTMQISEIKVWEVSDPFEANISGATSSNTLEKFRCQSPTYNGRLAHLLSTGSRGLGGLAQRPSHEFCPNRSVNHGFSNIDRTYSANLSANSWSVNVLAHELGHQMSSSHTHACAWNGNNTTIDDCGNVDRVRNNQDDDGDGEVDEFDEAEGGDCWDGSNPKIPNKGTIMSYCHLRAGNGVDLTLGFHPQVRAQMSEFANNCIEESLGCVAPGEEEILIEEITEFSAKITCTKTEGIGFYRFEYRLLGSDDWIDLESFIQDNFIVFTDLTPNTNYELRISIACEFEEGFSLATTSSCLGIRFKTLGITACTGFDVLLSDNITDPTCGDSNGSATIDIIQGTARYDIVWEGPTSGSGSSMSRSFTMNNLTEGNYSLTVTDTNDCTSMLDFRITDDEDCAALRCANKGVISCGTPIEDNLDGQPNDYDADDLKACIPNATGLDGPDKAYEFILTERTGISIRLSGLSNDMDMYLLDTCVEGGECLDLSLNVGTEDETINTVLEAGTYFVMVDRFENLGANDNFSLSLTCGDCNPDYSVVARNPVSPDCGESNGGINIVITDGSIPFEIRLDGPTSGNLQTTNRAFPLNTLAAGDYRVTVKDASDCETSTTFTIIDGCACNDYAVSLDNVTPIDCEGEGGNVDINITAGTAPFEIKVRGALNGNITTEDRTYQLLDLPEGTYQITVEDANECEIMQDLTIGIDCSGTCEGFTVNLGNSVDPTCANDDGSITVNVSGGTPNYTVSWSGASAGTQTISAGTYTISNLAAGDYVVAVSSADGCNKEARTTLEEAEGCDCPDFMVTVDNTVQPTCDGGAGAFRIVLSGGAGPYGIVVTGAMSNDFNITSEVYTFQNLMAGTYNVTITDFNNCSTSTSVILVEDGSACVCDDLSIDLRNAVNPTCADNDGKFDVFIEGGTGDFTIAWSGAATGTQMQGGRFFSVKNLPAGDYDILVTDANDCRANSRISLQAPSDCEEEDVCEGFSIDLRNELNPSCDDNDGKFDVFIEGGTGDFTIAWSGAATGTQMQGGRFFSVKNLPAGDYDILVTDANDCTTNSQITLTAPSDCEEEDVCEGFSIELKNAVNPTCADNDGKFDVTIQGGTGDFTIAWSGAATGTQIQGGRWFSVKNIPAGDYAVMVTDGNDCTTNATITLTAPSDCEDEGDVCEGFSIELKNAVNPTCADNDGKFDVTIQGGTADFTIMWSGAAAGTQMQGGRWFSVKNLTAGAYDVVVTDGNGCTANATITLTAPSDCEDEGDVCEGFSIELKNAVNPTCADNDGKFDVTIQGGTADFTIEWSGAATGTQVQGGRWFSVKNLAAGDYDVVVTDGNGCTTTATITLTAPSDCEEEGDVCEGFSIELKNAVNPTCADNDGKFDVTIQGGTADFTIMWSGAATGTQVQGGRWFSVKNLVAGAYDVVVTDGNGCTANATITLTAPSDCEDDEDDVCEGFSIELRNALNPTCNDNDGKFDVTIQGGTADFTIAWSGAATGTQMQGGRWFSVKNLPAGDYAVMVTDGNGCTTNATITLTAPSDCEEEDVCEGFSIDLRNAVNPSCDDNDGKFDIVLAEGMGDFMIAWSGAATGTQIQGGRWFSVKNLTAGDYDVVVTDGNGCTTNATITLTAPSDCEEEDVCEGFSIDLRNSVNPSCDNNDGKFDVFVEAGTGGFTITWSGAATGTQMQGGRFYSVKDLPAGDYNVMVTDSNDCTTMTTITLAAATGCDDTSDCAVESLACNEPLDGTTIGASNDFTSSDYDCYNQAYNFEGGDMVYSIEVPANTMRLTIELTRMSKDLDIFVLDGCTPGAACIAESGHNPAFLDERIRMDNPAAGTYYIVVDGATAIEASNFRLTAKCQAANLVDGTSVRFSNINSLEAFPNPTSAKLVAAANFSELTTARLELVNAMGQTIATYEAENIEFVQHQFDLSQQAAGVYFLKLQTATSTKIQQVVLMR